MEGTRVEQINPAVGDADKVASLQGPKDLVDGRTPNPEQRRKRLLGQRYFAVALFIEEDSGELLGKVASRKLQHPSMRVHKAGRRRWRAICEQATGSCAVGSRSCHRRVEARELVRSPDPSR
jgi:hypothetical protein